MTKWKDVLLSSGNDEWKTPSNFVKFINKNFKIDIDPCCSVFNVRAKKHFTKEQNGLIQNWEGNVYMNPPYSKISKWMQKAFNEYNGRCDLILCLVPSRTGANWFQHYGFKADYILFINKRLKYDIGKRKKTPAPFDSALIIYGKINRYQHKELKKIGALIKLG